MKQEVIKSILNDIQTLQGIVMRMKSRLPNLDTNPSMQLMLDAKTYVEKIEKTMSHNVAVLSEQLNYVRIDEVLNADQTLKEIGIRRLGQALRRTGLVQCSEMDIRSAFISRKWELKEDEIDESYIYGEDDFHVFAIVFALAYKRAKTFNIMRNMENI